MKCRINNDLLEKEVINFDGSVIESSATLSSSLDTASGTEPNIASGLSLDSVSGTESNVELKLELRLSFS